MLHFGCADAERQRAERAMRGGVTVAADDGHAWLGASKFGSDDMDNAAMRAGHAVQGDPEFSGIGFHLLDLRGGHRICNRDIDAAWSGWNDPSWRGFYRGGGLSIRAGADL